MVADVHVEGNLRVAFAAHGHPRVVGGRPVAALVGECALVERGKANAVAVHDEVVASVDGAQGCRLQRPAVNVGFLGEEVVAFTQEQHPGAVDGVDRFAEVHGRHVEVGVLHRCRDKYRTDLVFGEDGVALVGGSGTEVLHHEACAHEVLAGHDAFVRAVRVAERKGGAQADGGVCPGVVELDLGLFDPQGLGRRATEFDGNLFGSVLRVYSQREGYVDVVGKAVFVRVGNAGVCHGHRANLQEHGENFRRAFTDAVAREVADAAGREQLDLHAFGYQGNSACIELDFVFPDIQAVVVNLGGQNRDGLVRGHDLGGPGESGSLDGLAELQVHAVGGGGVQAFQHGGGNEPGRDAVLVEVRGDFLLARDIAYERNAAGRVRIDGRVGNFGRDNKILAVLRDNLVRCQRVVAVNELDGIEGLLLFGHVLVGERDGDGVRDAVAVHVNHLGVVDNGPWRQILDKEHCGLVVVVDLARVGSERPEQCFHGHVGTYVEYRFAVHDIDLEFVGAGNGRVACGEELRKSVFGTELDGDSLRGDGRERAVEQLHMDFRLLARVGRNGVESEQ